MDRLYCKDYAYGYVGRGRGRGRMRGPAGCARDSADTAQTRGEYVGPRAAFSTPRRRWVLEGGGMERENLKEAQGDRRWHEEGGE